MAGALPFLPAGTTIPPLPYLVAVLLAAGAVGLALRRTPPRVTSRHVLALAPWMALGSAAHVLYVVDALPPVLSPLAGSPTVYLTVGSLAGAVVGYLPGVSSAIAATVALSATPGRYGARGFLVTTSGVNTSNAVFALFALVALGSPRTGVLVAFEESGATVDLPLLLTSVALASVAGFLLVLALGDRYLDRVGRLDPRGLSLAVLGLLVVLSGLFAGWVGLVLFAVATLVGLLPVRLGVKRAHLMGVLLVPLALG